MAGEGSAMPRIVCGVMHRRQRRKPDEIHKPEAEDQRQSSDHAFILRQGLGA